MLPNPKSRLFPKWGFGVELSGACLLYTSYTKGVFSFFNILFGEQSLALGIGFYPSVWLLEGDAVLNETDFSNAGRGRSGEFLIYYRTAFLQGDIRSYDHWRYGSYRHYARCV